MHVSQQWKNRQLRFKIANNLRVRLNAALKNKSKAGSAVKDLGCSIEQLIKHIESKFQEGMTWDNWGKDGWHIDHIIPLSHFDLSVKEQFIKACNYQNLRPLWANDNLRKAASLNKEEVDSILEALSLPCIIAKKDKMSAEKLNSLLYLGYNTKRIAEELKMSISNVKYWAKKLGVKLALGKNCRTCGDKDSKNFYYGKKSMCKKCQSIKYGYKK